jgi:hypothetical protein
MYVVTSSSGLMNMSTAKPLGPVPGGMAAPSSVETSSSRRCVNSRERIRAILVRVPYSVHAIWHATTLTSSLLVIATIMSADSAPACCRVLGLAALPATVRMSMRSCRSRNRSSSRSTTVTSFASSRARW